MHDGRRWAETTTATATDGVDDGEHAGEMRLAARWARRQWETQVPFIHSFIHSARATTTRCLSLPFLSPITPLAHTRTHTNSSSGTQQADSSQGKCINERISP
jgi:hypothetical protein